MPRGLPNNPKIYIVIAVAAGVVWGFLRPGFLADDQLAGLLANLHQFAANFNPGRIGAENLAVSLLRNGHILLLIWACAAVPKLFWAAYLLLYLRAMTAAFSVALLLQAFGGQGALMAAALNIPQNALILAVCAWTICQIKGPGPASWARPVIIGILAVVAASAYEIYMAPWLFTMIL